MEIKIEKKYKVLIVLITVSLILGYCNTNKPPTSTPLLESKEIIVWQEVSIEDKPAFRFSIPLNYKHTIDQITFDQDNVLNTASFSSEVNGYSYVLNVTDFSVNLKNLPAKKAFEFTLGLVLNDENSRLIFSKIEGNKAEFQIGAVQDSLTKKGEMYWLDGYLVMQLVEYREGFFPEEDYKKFIDSLEIQNEKV